MSVIARIMRAAVLCAGGAFAAAPVACATSEVSASASAAAIDRDLTDVTIAQLHEYYARGKYSVATVIKWHLDRIDRLNPTYIAFTETYRAETLRVATALDEAAAAGRISKGPLWGVPVVIKANTSMAGRTTNTGWKGYTLAGRELVAPKDAPVVERLLAAGAIIIGQSNMPDFAKSDSNLSSVAGRTGNAYAPKFSPGGSSGGTAVAVALSLSVVGQGTDTGNSIRNPAANASLVGVLPTRGLVSIEGIHPYDWLLDNTGPIARTVADAALALEAMANPARGVADPVCRASDRSYARHLRRDALKGRRFGVADFVLNGFPQTKLHPNYWNKASSPATRALFLQALDALRAAGATVVIDPQILPEEFGLLAAKVSSKRYRREGVDDFLEHYGPAAYHSTKQFEALTGLSYPQDFIGDAQYRFELQSDPDADSEYRAPRRQLVDWYRTTLRRYKLDGLVYPALQVPPNDESQPLPADYPADGPYSNTNWVNRVGAPAVVVPAGYYENGLPFGIEFSADHCADGALLGYAYAYEAATRVRRAPPLAVSAH